MASGTTVNLRLLIQATNKAAKTVQSLQGQLNQVSKAAQELATKTKKAGADGSNAMKKLGASSLAVKAKLDAVKNSVEGVGSAGLALLGVAASLATTVFFPIKAAADFEHAMSKVVAVTSGAVEKFDELKSVASELGRTTKFTATEAAQGMVFLGQAGFEASEVISGIGPSLNLAIAAGISLAESADIATNIISAMRLPVQELADSTDVLSNTTASSNTNLLQLADAMAYAAPLAAAAGVQLEELAGIIGVLGNNGIQASQAGTAVRGMLRSLAAPSTAAKEVLKDLNVEIKQNADGSLGLVEALHDLAEAQLTTAQANKLFGRFAAAGALAVTANIEQLDELVLANYSAAGATERMAKIMHDNVKGAFVELTSALDGLKRAFGDPLLGVIKEFLHALTGVVGLITKVVEKFPVLTKVMGVLTGIVIILTASLGGLAIAISSVGAAAGQLSKAMGTQLGISLITAGKQLKNFTLLATTSTGVMAKLRVVLFALGNAFRWVGVQLKALWGLMLAHPYLVAIAAIGLLLVAMSEWSARNRRLIGESKKLASEMTTLHARFTQFEEKIAKAKEGSAKFTAQMLSMRTRLLEVSHSQKSLNLEATKAAHSIDEYTGKLTDGGKALEEYGEKVKDVGLKAMRDQLDGLNIEMDIMIGRGEGLVQVWHDITRGLKIIRALIPGLSYTMAQFHKEEKENWIATERQIESARRQYIKTINTMGRFDMSLQTTEAQLFFEVIEGHSKTSATELATLFGTMKEEMTAAKEKAVDFDSLSLEQVRTNVRETVDEIKNIQVELGEANILLAEAAAAWNKMTQSEKDNATEFKAQIKGIIDWRLKLSNADRDATKKFNDGIRSERDKALQEVQDGYDEESKALSRQLKLKGIQQFKYTEEQGKLDVKRSNDRIIALTKVLDSIAASGKFEVAEAKKTRSAFDREIKGVKKASLDLDDSRLIHARETAEAIRAINQEAANAENDLLADGKTKFEAQAKAEIASLRARAKAVGISQAAIATREESINKTTQRKIDNFNRATFDAREDARVAQGEMEADAYLDSLEAAFKKGEINVVEYVHASVTAQTAAIDTQIKVLETRLEKAKARFLSGMESEAVVIDLKLAVSEAKGKKGQIEREGVNLSTKLQQQKIQNELSLDQTLLQGKLNNLRTYKEGYEAVAEAELDLLGNKQDQEILQMELALAGTDAIRERKLQHVREFNLKEEELDRKTWEARQAFALESADKLQGIFGDLYDLSNQKAKHWFYLEKAAAIARVIISTQVAAMKVMEAGWVGMVRKGLIYAQGATSIAKITSQNLAKGGEVKGKSSHKRADNIKANLTAEEWVHPVDAVKYYGKKAMLGIQNMVFPKEIFSNVRMPRLPVPAYAGRGYAGGGEVKKQKDEIGIRRRDEIAAPQQSINIVNVVDPGELDRYLTSTAGQNAILNVLSSRREVVRRVLK